MSHAGGGGGSQGGSRMRGSDHTTLPAARAPSPMTQPHHHLSQHASMQARRHASMHEDGMEDLTLDFEQPLGRRGSSSLRLERYGTSNTAGGWHGSDAEALGGVRMTTRMLRVPGSMSTGVPRSSTTADASAVAASPTGSVGVSSVAVTATVTPGALLSAGSTSDGTSSSSQLPTLKGASNGTAQSWRGPDTGSSYSSLSRKQGSGPLGTGEAEKGHLRPIHIKPTSSVTPSPSTSSSLPKLAASSKPSVSSPFSSTTLPGVAALGSRQLLPPLGSPTQAMGGFDARQLCAGQLLLCTRASSSSGMSSSSDEKDGEDGEEAGEEAASDKGADEQYMGLAAPSADVVRESTGVPPGSTAAAWLTGSSVLHPSMEQYNGTPGAIQGGLPVCASPHLPHSSHTPSPQLTNAVYTSSLYQSGGPAAGTNTQPPPAAAPTPISHGMHGPQPQPHVCGAAEPRTRSPYIMTSPTTPRTGTRTALVASNLSPGVTKPTTPAATSLKGAGAAVPVPAAAALASAWNSMSAAGTGPVHSPRTCAQAGSQHLPSPNPAHPRAMTPLASGVVTAGHHGSGSAASPRPSSHSSPPSPTPPHSARARQSLSISIRSTGAKPGSPLALLTDSPRATGAAPVFGVLGRSASGHLAASQLECNLVSRSGSVSASSARGLLEPHMGGGSHGQWGEEEGGEEGQGGGGGGADGALRDRLTVEQPCSAPQTVQLRYSHGIGSTEAAGLVSHHVTGSTTSVNGTTDPLPSTAASPTRARLSLLAKIQGPDVPLMVPYLQSPCLGNGGVRQSALAAAQVTSSAAAGSSSSAAPPTIIIAFGTAVAVPARTGAGGGGGGSSASPGHSAHRPPHASQAAAASAAVGAIGGGGVPMANTATTTTIVEPHPPSPGAPSPAAGVPQGVSQAVVGVGVGGVPPTRPWQINRTLTPGEAADPRLLLASVTTATLSHMARLGSHGSPDRSPAPGGRSTPGGHSHGVNGLGPSAAGTTGEGALVGGTNPVDGATNGPGVGSAINGGGGGPSGAPNGGGAGSSGSSKDMNGPERSMSGAPAVRSVTLEPAVDVARGVQPGRKGFTGAALRPSAAVNASALERALAGPRGALSAYPGAGHPEGSNPGGGYAGGWGGSPGAGNGAGAGSPGTCVPGTCVPDGQSTVDDGTATSVASPGLGAAGGGGPSSFRSTGNWSVDAAEAGEVVLPGAVQLPRSTNAAGMPGSSAAALLQKLGSVNNTAGARQLLTGLSSLTLVRAPDRQTAPRSRTPDRSAMGSNGSGGGAGALVSVSPMLEMRGVLSSHGSGGQLAGSGTGRWSGEGHTPHPQTAGLIIGSSTTAAATATGAPHTTSPVDAGTSNGAYAPAANSNHVAPAACTDTGVAGAGAGGRGAHGSSAAGDPGSTGRGTDSGSPGQLHPERLGGTASVHAWITPASAESRMVPQAVPGSMGPQVATATGSLGASQHVSEPTPDAQGVPLAAGAVLQSRGSSSGSSGVGGTGGAAGGVLSGGLWRAPMMPLMRGPAGGPRPCVQPPPVTAVVTTASQLTAPAVTAAGAGPFATPRASFPAAAGSSDPVRAMGHSSSGSSGAARLTGWAGGCSTSVPFMSGALPLSNASNAVSVPISVPISPRPGADVISTVGDVVRVGSGVLAALKAGLNSLGGGGGGMGGKFGSAAGVGGGGAPAATAASAAVAVGNSVHLGPHAVGQQSAAAGALTGTTVSPTKHYKASRWSYSGDGSSRVVGGSSSSAPFAGGGSSGSSRVSQAVGGRGAGGVISGQGQGHLVKSSSMRQRGSTLISSVPSERGYGHRTQGPGHMMLGAAAHQLAAGGAEEGSTADGLNLGLQGTGFALPQM